MSNNQDIERLMAQLNSQQEQIARQLQDSNVQMQGLAKRVWMVQENERKQIAAELHDGVGQLLTALINQIQHTQNTHPTVDLSNSIELARQALSDTRVISRLMRPRILDDLGLVAALEWLVRVMGESTEAQVVFHHQVDVSLAQERQLLAFRVIQEALTNAIKHANANSITLNVIATETLLLIKIKDDGVGLPESALADAPGFGLGAMRDRICAFGGQLTIISEPNKGCEIKVLITGK